ncbi:hypothetical protein DEO72_LG7g1279 [Vigna unguiculata]|uniref:Uncharacterized protein n=1 Tax=Vigna unguiculata TaxID=3917 RepID=A0A4D6MEX4_VIGUN|nr:hypothetical protein DEO72_LG7g1279 [Vigna unguiculata]
MDTSVPVPARITLGRFITMHFVHNQEFGHVDRMFVAIFAQELGPIRQLEDIKGNLHQLTFNMDVNNPLLTDDYCILGHDCNINCDQISHKHTSIANKTSFAAHVQKRRFKRLEL